jgi:hypothetical protein
VAGGGLVATGPMAVLAYEFLERFSARGVWRVVFGSGRDGAPTALLVDATFATIVTAVYILVRAAPPPPEDPIAPARVDR